MILEAAADGAELLLQQQRQQQADLDRAVNKMTAQHAMLSERSPPLARAHTHTLSAALYLQCQSLANQYLAIICSLLIEY